MGDKTGISWTDASWNPVSGCAKVSAGCKHCYAEREWGRLQHLENYAGRASTDVGCHPDRLDQPLRWKRPRKIFVNSMSDLFHEAVPDWFIDRVFAVMALAKQHTFQVLTKRPERMLAYMTRLGKSAKLLDDAARTMGYTFEFRGQYLVAWPIPNVWLCVSVEDQPTADERIPLLLRTPAAVRGISAEPLLGPVDLGFGSPLGEDQDSSVGCYPCGSGAGRHEHFISETCGRGINWVVVGGESGPKARPMHPDWARSLREQCEDAGVPFFFKQTGLWQHVESVEDSRNLPPEKLKYFPEFDATFVRTKGGGAEELDGRRYQEWPRRAA